MANDVLLKKFEKLKNRLIVAKTKLETCELSLKEVEEHLVEIGIDPSSLEKQIQKRRREIERMKKNITAQLEKIEDDVKKISEN